MWGTGATLSDSKKKALKVTKSLLKTLGMLMTQPFLTWKCTARRERQSKGYLEERFYMVDKEIKLVEQFIYFVCGLKISEITDKVRIRIKQVRNTFLKFQKLKMICSCTVCNYGHEMLNSSKNLQHSKCELSEC